MRQPRPRNPAAPWQAYLQAYRSGPPRQERGPLLRQLGPMSAAARAVSPQRRALWLERRALPQTPGALALARRPAARVKCSLRWLPAFLTQVKCSRRCRSRSLLWQIAGLSRAAACCSETPESPARRPLPPRPAAASRPAKAPSAAGARRRIGPGRDEPPPAGGRERRATTRRARRLAPGASSRRPEAGLPFSGLDPMTAYRIRR